MASSGRCRDRPIFREGENSRGRWGRFVAFCTSNRVLFVIRKIYTSKIFIDLLIRLEANQARALGVDGGRPDNLLIQSCEKVFRGVKRGGLVAHAAVHCCRAVLGVRAERLRDREAMRPCTLGSTYEPTPGGIRNQKYSKSIICHGQLTSRHRRSNEGADVTVVGPLESRIETLCEACSSSVDKD